MPSNPPFDQTSRAQPPSRLLLIAIGDGPRLSRASSRDGASGPAIAIGDGPRLSRAAAATNAKKRLTRTERPRAVGPAAALESRGPSPIKSSSARIIHFNPPTFTFHA